MDDSAREGPETASEIPLAEQLLHVIARPEDHAHPNGGNGITRPEWQRDVVMQLLHDGGWVLPGLPPASKLLADAQQFAERVILAELAVRLFRHLILGGVVHTETPAAMDWLKDWIDGTMEGHGPIGKPMIWPDRLPFIAGLMRTWGFQPTPTQPPYVMRKPKPPTVLIEMAEAWPTPKKEDGA